MSKLITQKRFFIQRHAEIKETKVVYTSTVFGRSSQITIAFEDVSRHKEAHLLSRNPLLIAFGGLALFAFSSYMWRHEKDYDPNLWIAFSMLSIASAVLYLGSIEKLWKIRVLYNTYLFFFRDIPNSKEVDDFIETLFISRDKYLRETYFYVPTRNMSFETQRNNLLWLRKNEVISGAEFKDTTKELEELFNQDAKKIGFN